MTETLSEYKYFDRWEFCVLVTTLRLRKKVTETVMDRIKIHTDPIFSDDSYLDKESVY